MLRRKRRALLLALAAAAFAACLLVALSAHGSSPTVLFRADFEGPDRLLTNEYAYYNPKAPGIARSRQWLVTSGSLFVEDGAGTDGPIDHTAPDARSSNGTNSAVFRAYSRRHLVSDYRLTAEVRVAPPGRVAGLSPAPWDGLHLMLAAQSPQAAYYVSLYRRDRTAVIKKKSAGGPVAGGSYLALSRSVPTRIVPAQWTPIRVDMRSSPGSVTIDLYEGGELITTATDEESLSGSAPYLRGAIGIRADKTRFAIRDLVVEAL